MCAVTLSDMLRGLRSHGNCSASPSEIVIVDYCKLALFKISKE